MGHIRESIDIEAPIAACFALASDAKRLPEWNTVVTEVKDVSGPLDKVGTRYTTIARVAGRRIEGHNEIARAEAPSLIVTKGTAEGGGSLTITNTFEPHGTGTRGTVEIEYVLPGGLFGTIADKLFAERRLERDARHSNENFKALAEAEASKTGSTAAPVGSSA